MDDKQKKTILFFVFASLLVFLLVSIAFLSTEIINNWFWFLLLLLFFVFVWKGEPLILLKDYERAIIFRFGKVNRVGGPGWALRIPGIESFKVVDLRTQTIDVEKQDVITKDLIELKIDAVLYLHVGKDNASVIKSVIEIKDFSFAARTLVVSAIRNLIGSMTLAEVISNVDKLNEELKKELEKITSKWGVVVEAVEMKDVDIPKIVIDAMHEEKAALQEKLARFQRAEAKKIEIQAVQEAAGNLSDKALAYYYIRALEEISKGRSTKIVFPMEFSRLASKFTGKIGEASALPEDASKYRKILEETINKAVQKIKKKSS